MANNVLIGITTYVPTNLPMPQVQLNPQIKQAIKKGWEPFLKKEGIIAYNRIYLPCCKQGIYLRDARMKNVAGVIIVRKSDDFHFVPNPFVADEINDPCMVRYLV